MVRSALFLVLGLGLVACGDKPPPEAPPPGPSGSASAVVEAPPPPKAKEVAKAPSPTGPAPVEEGPVPEPTFSLASVAGSEGPSQAAGIEGSVWMNFLSSVIFTPDNVPFGIPAASKLRTPAARVALVKGLFPAARALVASPWFAARYANVRREKLREQPREKFQARSAGEIDQTLQAQMQAQIAALEQAKTTPGLGPAQVGELDRAVNELKKQLAAAKSKPTGTEQAAREAEVQKQMETLDAAEAENRKAERAALEKRWPADPKQLVAMRLAEVLELTKDVDFGAKTKKNAIGQQRFVKDEHEAKPRLWKAAFRAGKPTYDACRAFAQQWQEDLRAGKW